MNEVEYRPSKPEAHVDLALQAARSTHFWPLGHQGRESKTDARLKEPHTNVQSYCIYPKAKEGRDEG